MLDLSSLQLQTWLGEFFWPFFRILALLSAAPVLGSRGIPTTVKISTAFVITIVVAPIIPPVPNISVASAQGLIVLLQQLLIGFSMGIAIKMVLIAMEMAGHIIGLQMGLGFATFFDPQNGTQVPLMGQFLSVMATLLFLVLNGHLMVIAAMVDSFQTLPIGTSMAVTSFKTLAVTSGNIFSWGVQIAMPVMAALMLVNVALGVLTRAAPQLNIFAVGFPLTMGVGFIILAISIPYILPVFNNMMEDAMKNMTHIAVPATRSTP